MIYAIRAVGTQYIKFGKATSVGKRLKELETASPFDLHIEAVGNWPDETERQIHAYLEKYCQRNEWFRESEDSVFVISLLRDQELGHERWRSIQKKIRKAKQAEIRKAEKAKASQQPALQASQQKNSKSFSTTPSKATETALQFMQSLMTWESNTLRSIATSSNTEKANGETLRSVEL